jgi:hypothetical protein
MIIYILELEKSKYFIGSTNNLQTTLQNHYNKIESEWTKKYLFKDVIETYEGERLDETKTTILYMDKFGIENVRGGVYNKMELSFEDYLNIRKNIYFNNNLCTACGKTGHLLENCNELICYRCGRLDHMGYRCIETTHYNNGKLNGCYRCGRPDHWHYRCNRSKDIYGRKLHQDCVIS